MICILARDRKPDYYEKLKTILFEGRAHLQQGHDCMVSECSDCENRDICWDTEKAIMFLEQEQLRAELKRQNKLP